MQNMAIRMGEKYDKYWEECDLLISFGSILDPRFKRGMLRFAYKFMYPEDSASRITMVENAFSDLYAQYANIYGDNRKGKAPENYSSYLSQPPSSSVLTKVFDEFMETEFIPSQAP